MPKHKCKTVTEAMKLMKLMEEHGAFYRDLGKAFKDAMTEIPKGKKKRKPKK